MSISLPLSEFRNCTHHEVNSLLMAGVFQKQMIFHLFFIFSLDYVELPSAVQKVDPEDCEEGNHLLGYMNLYIRLTMSLWLVRLH